MLKAIVNGAEKDIVRIPMLGDGPATVTGTNSVTFETDATSIIDYTIKGNLQQSGTPSSSSPIYPSETGERTENLFDEAYTGISSDITYKPIYVGDGTFTLSSTCSQTQSNTANLFFISGNVSSGAYTAGNGVWAGRSITAQSTNGYVTVAFRRYGGHDSSDPLKCDTMLNSGSTALPYEPYGKYKLPITCANSTSNIYLQEPIRKIGDYVDAAGLSIGGANRKIKKLVLTGEENWTVGASNYQASCSLTGKALSRIVVCSHYTGQVLAQNGYAWINAALTNLFIMDTVNCIDVNTFKTYLQQQYSAGTPVTIWYVLASEEHETATIPTIPTAKGSNTLSIGTTLSPSSMEVTYLGIKNTYKEGWEIRDQQDRLIWGRNETLTGTSSISFEGYGLPLKSMSITGNGQQSGTPAPDAPIMPEFVGERTINLYDDTSTVTLPTGVRYGMVFSPGIYSIRNDTENIVYDFSNNGASRHELCQPHSTATITFYEEWGECGFFMPYDELSLGGVAIVSGSTPPDHYEPYGYKIPITNAGQTVPIYLGQAQTVRRIKKLVFDGTENWNNAGVVGIDTHYFVYRIGNYQTTIPDTVLCTHFQSADINTSTIDIGCDVINSSGAQEDRIAIRPYNTQTTSVEDFTNWLKSQYSAGTPVTVWYVLAEPETAIVNEPLAKNGNYADELTINPDITPQIGENTLTVDTTLSPSSVSITGHIRAIP